MIGLFPITCPFCLNRMILLDQKDEEFYSASNPKCLDHVKMIYYKFGFYLEDEIVERFFTLLVKEELFYFSNYLNTKTGKFWFEIDFKGKILVQLDRYVELNPATIEEFVVLL